MFELLMLAAFLYAGFIHLLPPEKGASEAQRAPFTPRRKLPAAHSPRRKALPRRPAARLSARLGKPGELC